MKNLLIHKNKKDYYHFNNIYFLFENLKYFCGCDKDNESFKIFD